MPSNIDIEFCLPDSSYWANLIKTYEMTTNRKMYVRFLHATLLHETENKLPNFDLVELKLLEILAVASETGKPMNVGEAMSANWIASPATLHRKIRTLIDAGYVEQQFEGKNRRTKHLVPTNKAMKYFACLGNALKASIAI